MNSLKANTSLSDKFRITPSDRTERINFMGQQLQFTKALNLAVKAQGLDDV